MLRDIFFDVFFANIRKKVRCGTIFKLNKVNRQTKKETLNQDPLSHLTKSGFMNLFSSSITISLVVFDTLFLLGRLLGARLLRRDLKRLARRGRRGGLGRLVVLQGLRHPSLDLTDTGGVGGVIAQEL